MSTYLLVFIITSCSTNTKHTIESVSECIETSTPISEYTWSGLSAEELLSQVNTTSPTEVEWDALTLTENTSTITATVTERDSTVYVVERNNSGTDSRSCRPGPEIALPISLEISIDSGDATATADGTLFADEFGNAYLYVWDSITLSDEWEEQAYSYLESNNEAGTSPEWELIIWHEPWSDAQIDIEAVGENYRATLWRGHWTD